jgi:hypothetical protein
MLSREALSRWRSAIEAQTSNDLGHFPYISYWAGDQRIIVVSSPGVMLWKHTKEI